MRRCSCCLGLAMALLLPNAPAVASLLPVTPPTSGLSRLFEFEVKAKAPEFRNGTLRKGGEVEGKVKWEIKDPLTGRETKLERKLKLENLTTIPTTIPFVFSTSPVADGGVQLVLQFGDRSLDPLVLTADQAGALPNRLVEVEIKVESTTKDFARPATAFAEALGFGDVEFARRIEATAPSTTIKDGEPKVEDEVKTTRFFALAGGDPIAVPFVLSGTAGAVGDWKEFKVKVKFGNADFVAPPRPEPPGIGDPMPEPGEPVAVSEPAALAVMLAGLIGVAAMRRSHILG